jgi:beta-galactosidase/beta-glucuronidase
MVWQDLMFNGTMYPGDSMFKDAVTTEVNAQAMRLNNHPSLALWCGNNEIEVAWHNWGWQQKYNLHGEDSAQQWRAYLSLFDTLIPTALLNWNAGVPYTRSSPIGNWGNLQQMKRGDNHDWGVWHGERGFAHLDSARMPFCSEYGLPSPPDWAISQNGKEQDWRSLLLSYKGPKLLEKYVHDEYPKTWPGQGSECAEVMNFGDSAAVVQGEFLYRAMINHRMASPYCMGSLYWQYNDIWNGTTWSVANSLHGWSMLKSSQSRVSEAMLPVVMRLQRSGWWGAKDQFYVQLNSRLLTDTEVKLMVTAYDSMGRALFQRNVKRRVPRNLNLSDGLMGGTTISPISFAHKGKFMRKMDRVSFYEVRMEQPAAAQRLLDLTPKGKHYGEGYPVLVEYLSVED